MHACMYMYFYSFFQLSCPKCVSRIGSFDWSGNYDDVITFIVSFFFRLSVFVWALGHALFSSAQK